MGVLGRLPTPFRWTVHNLIAHPLSEVVFLISYVVPYPMGVFLRVLSQRIHDETVPE